MKFSTVLLVPFLSTVLAAPPKCRGNEKSLLIGHANHPLEFCRTYHATPRRTSPFPVIRAKRLTRICDCIVKKAGKAPKKVKVAAFHKNQKRCNPKDVAKLRAEYPNAQAFARWWLSSPRTRSTMYTILAPKNLDAAAACIISPPKASSSSKKPSTMVSTTTVAQVAPTTTTVPVVPVVTTTVPVVPVVTTTTALAPVPTTTALAPATSTSPPTTLAKTTLTDAPTIAITTTTIAATTESSTTAATTETIATTEVSTASTQTTGTTILAASATTTTPMACATSDAPTRDGPDYNRIQLVTGSSTTALPNAIATITATNDCAAIIQCANAASAAFTNTDGTVSTPGFNSFNLFYRETDQTYTCRLYKPQQETPPASTADDSIGNSYFYSD